MQGDATENEWFEKIWPLVESKKYLEVIKITLPYWEKIAEPKFEQDFSYHIINEMFYSYLKLNILDEARIWLDNYERFDFKKADRYDDGDFEIAKGNYFWALNDQEKALQAWATADKKTKSQCFRSPEAEIAKSVYRKAAIKGDTQSSKKTKVSKNEIKNICELGSEHMEKNKFLEAESYFSTALNLLQSPAADHEYYHWILASLGDACLSQNKLKEAESHLLEASKGMIDNPYVWLQLGRTYRLQSKTKKATDALLKAYMIEGQKIFEDSQEDLNFLKSKIKM
ncbi:MAG: hypothetical protein IPN71_03840 [Fibrobacteres bacterium]|nr:hypothetical protein [Fibrobacterota bacterium]